MTKTELEIQNLEITEGVQNWTKYGMTSGAVNVTLPNGTLVTIQASVKGDWNSCTIDIHHLEDTELTIFNNDTKLTKKMTRYDDETVWTRITTKEE